MCENEPLEAVRAVGLPIDDVKNLLVELLSLGESRGPVVSGAASVLGQVDVLRVVEFLILAVHDVVDDARLQIQEDGAWDVVLIVSLVIVFIDEVV